MKASKKKPRLPRVLACVLLFAGTLKASSSRAEPAPVVATAPAVTLEVESDRADFTAEVLRDRLSKELAEPVAQPGDKAARVAIRIRLVGQTLTVRAIHSDAHTIERTIPASDGAPAIDEAVLLAGNLARDEAHELIATLGPRSEPRPPAQESAPALAPSAPPEVAAPEERWAATFALAYPIATNMGRPNVASALDVSLFYGRVGRVTGLAMTLGASAASRGVSGAQLSSGVAYSGGPTRGAQTSVVVSWSVGPTEGAQIGALLTYTGADVDGAQVSSVTNLSRGEVAGAQLSGLLNYAGGLSGVQATSALNVAGRVRGAQASPINIARDVSGVQLGLVNVAKKVKGAQLALVNIAEEVDGAAIGLVSLSRDSFHPILFTSTLAYTNAGIKFANKYVYTLVAIGAGTHETQFDGPLVTTALGARWPIGKVDLELESAYSIVDDGTKTNQASHTRLIGGYSFAKHLRVFVGGGARVPIHFERGRDPARPEFLGGIQF